VASKGGCCILNKLSKRIYMADDEFFSLQEVNGLSAFSDTQDENEEGVFLQKFAFEIPTHLFSEMGQAAYSYEVMMQASDTLSFAYCDMIRKIEII
jgi:hypothetical protein